MFFAAHYVNDGGFYLVTNFEIDGKTYRFVMRRPYSRFTEVVFGSHFDGFSLAVLDHYDSRILIEKGALHPTHNKPLISTIEPDIIYRKRFPSTYWELAAIPVANHTSQMLQQIIYPKVITVVAFVFIIGLAWVYLKRIHRVELIREEEQNQLRQRANNVLSAIDEVVITTDKDNLITYLNPQAKMLLRHQGENTVIDMDLSDVWSDNDALWNKKLTLEELSILDEEPREIHIQMPKGERTLEQSYSIIYDNNADIAGVAWVLRDVTEAVQARKAIEVSRQRYKEIFAGAGVAHCLIKIDQDEYLNNPTHTPTLIHANDAAIELFSAEALDELLVSFPQIIQPVLEHFNRQIRFSIESKIHHREFEIQINSLIGEERVLIVNLSITDDDSENALITFINITERRRFITELKERERFWARIMNTVPDIVYVVSLDSHLDFTIEYTNRKIASALGYSQDELKNRNTNESLLEHIKPEHQPRLLESVKRVSRMTDGEIQEEQGILIDNKGQERVFQFINTPFEFDDSGRVSRYVGTARDVTDNVNSQKAIIENEKKYRLLAENISDVIWSTNTKLECDYISPSVKGLSGYSQDEIYNLGLNSIIEKQDWINIKTILNRYLKDTYKDAKISNPPPIDAHLTTSTGETIIIELRASILYSSIGAVEGVLGIIRDVSEARRLDNEMRLAAKVFEDSNEAIIVMNSQMEIINTNQAFEEMTALTLDEVRGKMPNFILNPEYHSDNFFNTAMESIISSGYWQGETHFLKSGKEERVGWTGISAVKDRLGQVQNLILVTSDITERKVIEQRIHKLAYFDPLTGLPNRSQMHEKLEQLLTKARRKNQSIALLFIDLDRFKPINDSMGHPAGDQVLQEVAKRLRNCIKRNDVVARMGGDEFTIALEEQIDNNAAADTAVKVGERILHNLNKAIGINGKELFISASVGISIFPNDGQTVTELLKNSDVAMYHAKDSGRGTVKFFNENMNSKAVELLELENELRFALSRNEFVLNYQPQYCSATHQVQGVEALLRWHHPTRGLISPAVFIPIIEDTGLIVPIGEWVLNQACKDLAQWQEEGVGIPRMAVNVSARQFKQENFVEIVQRTIQLHNIDPSWLELELTESILIDNLEHTLSVLKQLRDMGVRVAIDDFGTGYSSLNYLRQFPVDTLKIDQSFIRNLTTNKDDMQITRTIVSMAHNLGLGVIAEGVETKEQLDFLTDLKCEEIQGFYFSRPHPKQELIPFISDQQQSVG